MRTEGKRQAEIAGTLCRSRSTVGRELRRDEVVQRKAGQNNNKRPDVPLSSETPVYFADVGERQYRKRRKSAGVKCRLAQCRRLSVIMKSKRFPRKYSRRRQPVKTGQAGAQGGLLPPDWCIAGCTLSLKHVETRPASAFAQVRAAACNYTVPASSPGGVGGNKNAVAYSDRPMQLLQHY